jgi:hypothetical protein
VNPDVYRPFVSVLGFNLLALLVTWLYYANRTLWPRSRKNVGRIYRCAQCAHVYVDQRDVPMARCPECDRFNEAIRR